MFNAEQFKTGFDKKVKDLGKAEKSVRETLRDMSRDLLLITQETEDIGYVNRTVEALSPANKRIAVLYFKEFSGFLYDDDKETFTKKSKKKYEEIVAKALKFLEDPNNNIWPWQARNVIVDRPPFKVEDVTKFSKSILAKATKEGISQTDILKAFFAGGFSVDSIVAVMGELAKQDA